MVNAYGESILGDNGDNIDNSDNSDNSDNGDNGDDLNGGNIFEINQSLFSMVFDQLHDNKFRTDYDNQLLIGIEFN